MDSDGDGGSKDDSSRRHSPSPTPSALLPPAAAELPADEDRSIVEAFLSRLFHDRFLTGSPAASSAPPPQPQPQHQSAPNNLVPFFAAASVFPAPQHSDQNTTEHASPRRRSLPAAATPMQHLPQHVVFRVDDTVNKKEDKNSIGVVDRSFTDVDTHEPRPQRDYGEDLERHPDIPLPEFQKFLRTGIPPRGAVLVSWQTQLRTELIPEAQLHLLDRALYVGDVVKRRAEDHMSGTVVATEAICNLFPVSQTVNGAPAPETHNELALRHIPAEELLNVHEYVRGAIVVYGDWVGRIDNVYDEVAVKLSNNSVVVVENPLELQHEEVTNERMSVGDIVKTKKGNLRRGLWKYGAFDPNIKPEGMVVETRTVEIDVQWLERSIGAQDSQYSAEEPPVNLGRDEFESPDFYRYDAAASAAEFLLPAANGVDREYHVTDVAVGDRVRFKDLAGAAVKYDGSHILGNGLPQGKLTRLPRTETLGYDMNVFLVMQTQTLATVQWQDLTITDDYSSSLIPDPNVEDDDEVWPGEIVCSKEDKAKHSPDEVGQLMKEPLRVGVVQQVKSRDRIANVRWFRNHDIKFFGADLLRPAVTGELSQTGEDISLYDVYSSPALTRRRGDFVLIHPSGIQQDLSHINGPTWFGEVVDLSLDGKVIVRLGAAKPVIDITVSYENVTLAYSSDMDNGFLNTEELDGDSIEDSDEDISDFDSASFNEMWIEYEGMEGEPPEGDEADWSTEEEEEVEEDADDISMPDVEPVDGVDTSKTTPDPIANSEPTDSAHVAVESVASQPRDNTESLDGAPASFLILDTPPPSSHYYLNNTSTSSTAFMRRIGKEHKILRGSLPPNIFVRTWESRLDLIRVLMIGPSDTPYEYAPFVIDFHLGSSYPQTPPEAFFHSWTDGNGPVNPNLYEDGKICLSLLGTWHTDERNESWSPAKSTLLQVLVSIMGLVLVKDPYYNEAGYDVQRAAPETRLNSALYTERAYFRARAFISHALSNTVEPFSEELQYLYRNDAPDAPRLLVKAIEAAKDVVERSSNAGEDGERDGLRTISLGAVVMLKRQVEKLESLRQST